ncbi:MAG: hypothetical protein WBM52_07835, partial [Thiogranum sp.]
AVFANQTMPAHFSQFFGWSGTAQALPAAIDVPAARIPASVACKYRVVSFHGRSPLEGRVWPGSGHYYRRRTSMRFDCNVSTKKRGSEDPRFPGGNNYRVSDY